jgi:hypothetical protein
MDDPLHITFEDDLWLRRRQPPQPQFNTSNILPDKDLLQPVPKFYQLFPGANRQALAKAVPTSAALPPDQPYVSYIQTLRQNSTPPQVAVPSVPPQPNQPNVLSIQYSPEAQIPPIVFKDSSQTSSQNSTPPQVAVPSVPPQPPLPGISNIPLPPLAESSAPNSIQDSTPMATPSSPPLPGISEQPLPPLAKSSAPTSLQSFAKKEALSPPPPPPANLVAQQQGPNRTFKITPNDVAWTRMWLVRYAGMHPGAAALLAPYAAPAVRYGMPLSPEVLALFQPPEMSYVTYRGGRPMQWSVGGYTWGPIAMKRADLAQRGMELAANQQQAALGAVGAKQQATTQAEAQNMQNILASGITLPQNVIAGVAKQEPPAVQAPGYPGPSVSQGALGESARRAQTDVANIQAQQNAQMTLLKALSAISQLPDVQKNPELLKQIQQAIAGLQGIAGSR